MARLTLTLDSGTAGLTFDTGALIGLERSRHAMRKVLDVAVTHRVPITVPAIVVAEWWRGGLHERYRADLLRALRVEPLDVRIARLAGEALGRIAGSGAADTADAIVMASASLRGDIVYTSDPEDLERLRVAAFPNVRIERA